jgi:N6-L-threonylcarbamoyladenine synthase
LLFVRRFQWVVPELASRVHQQNIIPAVHQAFVLAKSGAKSSVDEAVLRSGC